MRIIRISPFKYGFAMFKCRIFFILMSLWITSVALSSNAKLAKDDSHYVFLDEVSVVLHGPENTSILCVSDDGRPGIDGQPRKLSQCIHEDLMYQDALRMGIPMDQEIIEERLHATLRGFGLKPGDETEIFAREGYTYEEGMNRFRQMYGVNAVTELKIAANLIIPEADVVKYYEENPLVIEESFFLQTGLLKEGDFADKISSKDFSSYVDSAIKDGSIVSLANWSNSFWLKKSEINESLAELMSSMEVGEVVKVEVPSGVQLYKLNDYQKNSVVPLAERYKDIAETLRRPLFVERLEEYKRELLSEATIIYR